MSDFDDPEIQFADEDCPKCTARMYMRPCSYCDEDGMVDHDCGDDTCCCLHPEPNVRCDFCRGDTFVVWCRKCGWDKTFGRYLK